MHESLPIIIQDLAYILIVAGFTTVLFKKLKQPLVLGYIVSGFLAGPYMPYMPNIIDTQACNDWGQIGVIFIMFTLGLEFSFKRIVKMGISPILCVCMIMGGMIGVGNAVGNLFHWSTMDSLFLGGMLSMSSTTIIYKAYEELNLSHKKFAGNVLSVLILEDIMGILLMVVLSTIAATRQFQGDALVSSLLTLGSILLLWFLVGVFLLPLILKRYKRYMNQETLMIVSLALCFLLVLLSNKAGYSPAFGAFMMGSILSETSEAEHIEHAVSPVKDLFGAIFFVSVGMMVSPMVIVNYWMEILVLTISIILGQTLIGTSSYLLTGSSLKDSIHSGFSMTQIGEFAFIIASIGEALNVTSPKLYPIVVAVSIITTFLTPYMIKIASPVCNIVSKHINGNIDDGLNLIDNLGSRTISNKIVLAWRRFMMEVTYQTSAYMVLTYAFLGIIFALNPVLETLLRYFVASDNYIFYNIVGYIVVIVSLICISPFLRAICIRKNRSVEARYIHQHGRLHRVLLYTTFAVRFAICTGVIYSVVNKKVMMSWQILLLLSIMFLTLILCSRTVKYVSISLERIFKQNLHFRENQVSRHTITTRMLKGSDLHITTLKIPELSLWAGKYLKELDFSHNYDIHIASIVRGHLRLNIPDGNNRVFPGDLLEIVGDDESIEAFRQHLESEVSSSEEYFNKDRLTLKKFVISDKSRFVGQSLKTCGLRHDFHCTVIGFEDSDGNIDRIDANRQIQPNDIIWVVGEFENLMLLELVTDPPVEIIN